MTLPTTVEARTARLRAGLRDPEDLAWLRATVIGQPVGWALPGQANALACDCRCACHLGPCGFPIDLADMDCSRACRAAHILASECYIDQTRSGVSAHV